MNESSPSPGLLRGAVLPIEETLLGLMGIQIVESTAERCTGTMPVAPNRQPYGLLHGGANAVLAETLGSIAAAQHAQSLGLLAVGVELNCTHHGAVRQGTVHGTATLIHGGSRIATYQITIDDDRGRTVCTSRLTCFLLPEAPSAEPRSAPDEP